MKLSRAALCVFLVFAAGAAIADGGLPAQQQSWRSPSVACDLLKDEGLGADTQVTTGLVWFEAGLGGYGCGTHTKVVSREGVLENSIDLGVTGTTDTAKIFDLALSVFDTTQKKDAQAEFLRLATVLLDRIDGIKVPPMAANAIGKARHGVFRAGRWILDVRRTEYVNARKGGYQCRLLVYETGTPKPPVGF